MFTSPVRTPSQSLNVAPRVERTDRLPDTEATRAPGPHHQRAAPGLHGTTTGRASVSVSPPPPGGPITGDLLTPCGGSSGEPPPTVRLRHIPAGTPAAGYFAVFFLRSAFLRSAQ